MEKNNLYKKTASIIKEAGNLEIISKKIVDGFLIGKHFSSFQGYNTEFSEHKQYEFGDNIRDIDWKLYARTDRLYTKKYSEETNMRTLILLDGSASMAFGDNISKWNYASLLVSTLSYFIIKQRDSIGLWIFNDDIEKILPPKNSKSYFYHICKQLEKFNPKKSTYINKAIKKMAMNLKRRFMIVIISDFLTHREDIFEAISILSKKKHDIIVFHILDPMEYAINYKGSFRFKDMETGDTEIVDVDNIKKIYKDTVGAFIKNIRTKMAFLGCEYVFLKTDYPLEIALRRYIIKRKRGKSLYVFY